MTRNFITNQSKIHGKGAFATKDFEKGDIIFIFKGRVYKRDNKNVQDTFANPDSIGIDKNTWIDPIRDFHFINHSCDPNMGIKGRVTFCALKNIRKGEELTFDYSINEADPRWHMKCNCGARNCRKVIKSVQSLPVNIYKHYMPFVPRYFMQVYNKSRKLT
ncbi:SET domain-containing protein-lysine N-methyltransferase [Candidatus Parcubacteria bacterium]|nr:SET domain-containing protein-lysine N-methyltransferase [Candidatus Parcubacteria bacterium]